MGDYNAEPESKVKKNASATDSISLLTPKWWLQRYMDPIDFNGFGTIPIKERKIIDYILLVEISTFKNITFLETCRMEPLSDHSPVFIKISL
jgi:endonuclease/exonuclease/phosphatase family metal-dependent hydrolase